MYFISLTLPAFFGETDLLLADFNFGVALPFAAMPDTLWFASGTVEYVVLSYDC